MYAASAIAANTIARSACGAAAPLFTNQMFTAMGIGGGGSLIGGVATVLGIIPFLFYKYGKQIRVRSKFAPAFDVKKNQTTDEEAGAASGGIQGESERHSVSESTETASSESTVGEAEHEGEGQNAVTGATPVEGHGTTKEGTS